MTDLDEFKNKQLELLHELDRVCKLANINYYLAYGTCLGAVRHQGYIPWDDDIDIFMPVAEMEKLMNNKELFNEKYFLQCRATDPNYQLMKYSLRDSTTAYFPDERDCEDINHGIYIDIYILYPYPDNFVHAHKLIIDSYILRFLYLKSAPVNHGIMGRLGSKVLSLIYKGKRADRKIRKVELDLMNNGGKKYYSTFYGEDITPFSCFKYPVKYFAKPCMLKFEDYLAPCPSNPNAVCELMFGKTYMELPPEEERVPRHPMLYMSCDVPYTEFEGKYYNKPKII